MDGWIDGWLDGKNKNRSDSFPRGRSTYTHNSFLPASSAFHMHIRLFLIFKFVCKFFIPVEDASLAATLADFFWLIILQDSRPKVRVKGM